MSGPTGHPLDAFYYPRSVAIVGASADPSKAGHQITRNLKELGFPGPIYPVNPRETSLFGLPVYPTLTDVPGPVDLMVVSIPAAAVPEVFRQAQRRGDVKAAVVLASGFSETKQPAGIALEREIQAIAREAGIRFLGPNCVGVMNTAWHLDTTFAPGIKQVPGKVSVISQSGALGAAILMFATHQSVPIGFAKWTHVGNQADVSVLEVLEYYAADPDTGVIAMYLEGLEDARAFWETARRLTPRKPIVVIKAGRSDLGSKAASSHTGSLAGSDRVYDAALRQAGVLRVESLEDLVHGSRTLATQPLPRPSGRILVLTEAGGPGIIAMDELGRHPEVRPAILSETTRQRLREILPPMAIVDQADGYVDMTAAAQEAQHAQALEAVLADPGVDGVVLVSVPPTFLDCRRLGEAIAETLARTQAGKPVTVCLMAGEWVRPAREAIEQQGVPTFDMPEQAARAMALLVRRARDLQEASNGTARADGATARPVPRPVGRGTQPTRPLLEPEALALLGPYLARVGAHRGQAGEATEAPASPYLAPHRVVTSAQDAEAAARLLGCPVVLKVVSPDILHKSDVGGVRLGVADPAAAGRVYEEMLREIRGRCPTARIEGVLVTPQAPPGHEVIVGGRQDRQFGPVVLFGMGGIFVEVLEDVAVRLAPLSRAEAAELVRSIRLWPLLSGARGQAPADIEALIDIVCAVSELLVEHPEVREVDLNPVRVYPHGARILDARVIVG